MFNPDGLMDGIYSELLSDSSQDLIYSISPDTPDEMMEVYSGRFYKIALELTGHFEKTIKDKLPGFFDNLPIGFNWQALEVNKMFAYYTQVPNENREPQPQRGYSRNITSASNLHNRLRDRRTSIL